jgi:hypothetical protein
VNPDEPDIEIVSGSPTPAEEAAIREAIRKLWRDERAEAERAASGMSAWVRAGRAGSAVDLGSARRVGVYGSK